MNLEKWRDTQIDSFTNLTGQTVILEQELVMLNFVTQFADARWTWLAPHNKFYDICKQHINIVDHDHSAVIAFVPAISGINPFELVQKITDLTLTVKYAYIAVNRYFIKSTAPDCNLPDSIEDSLDILLSRCNPNFKRLANFKEVDGNHMVFAHPMDCYGLCK
jgi:hypothetical protein